MIRYGACLLLALSGARGQSGPTLVGVGYAPPVLTVAPGQIVTLQVTGLKTVLAQPAKSGQVPLPTQLAGISVTLNQYLHGDLRASSTAVPIFSIQQNNGCYDGSTTADCMVTFITVQIPYEMQAILSGNPYQAELVTSENGVSGKGFAIHSNPDNIHVLTGCGGGACVTHANGALVNSASPANPGETVVIYAVGLGYTNPPAQTGQAAPASASVVFEYIGLDFSPNAGPSQLAELPGKPAGLVPAFAGLTPGGVGLYQVNVTLPATFPAVPSCGSSVSPFYPVSSNLTINIGSDYGTFDGAPICVKPPQ